MYTCFLVHTVLHLDDLSATAKDVRKVSTCIHVHASMGDYINDIPTCTITCTYVLCGCS